jgi:hypothetical protein
MASKKQDQNIIDDVFSYFRGAFDSGMNSAQSIHQAGANIPLSILQSLGVAESKTDSLGEKHEEIIDTIYGSVRSIVAGIGNAGVEQVNLLRDALTDEKPTRQKKAS